VTEHIDLGGFLRARREALQPADVGLRDSGRRRTPGLRREEVAALAGVSIDYLVRLEQGRDTKPSAAVLAALSDALQLNEDEHRHLAVLAAISSSPEMCPSSLAAGARAVPDTVRTLVTALAPTPAFVLAPWGDVLVANEPWQALAGALGLVGDPPNLARFTFLDPHGRAAYPDWDAVADQQVNELRTADLRWGRDPLMAPLLAELMEAPEFARRWSEHGVADKRRGEQRVAHPALGTLRVAYEVLLLPDAADQRLVTWLPADERTAAALATLVTRPEPVSPAVLRVVG
jgi:transcriptional regulator with XRE-family HTH domain